MRKISAILLCLILAAGMLAGCQGNTPVENQPPQQSTNTPVSSDTPTPEPVDSGNDVKATLTFAAWDTLACELYTSLDLEGRFQQIYPNVTIEIEQSKDDSEYWNSMKVRASANQLPDIMYNKPFTLSRFKDYLYDLSDMTEIAANNVMTAGYIVDGKILGFPEKSVGDYVFYWTDMFNEAGVSVPVTWSQMIDVSKQLQTYYGANDPNFSAIAIGGKDEWPTYPYTEFMPCLISGNGQNWNTMATQDAPFADGTDVRKAYDKIYNLFTSGAYGKDPLGIGHDQAVSLFAQKKSAMIAAGPWCLSSIEAGTDDISALKTFYLPVRDSESDPFYIIAQGDNFMGVTINSQNPDIAKEFVKFYFSDAWYRDYIDNISDDSTMSNFPKDKAPVLKAADEARPDAQLVMYDGGGDDFTAVQNEVKFDYKKLGAQMFSSGFDLNGELSALNDSWAAARSSLGN